MALLSWMLVGHMVGDYLFQTNWMAQYKASKPLILMVHSAVYTACVTLVTLPAGRLSVVSILILFISHALLDQRSFVNWWCRHITKGADTPRLVTLVDQSWHAVFLALACFVSGLY